VYDDLFLSFGPGAGPILEAAAREMRTWDRSMVVVHGVATLQGHGARDRIRREQCRAPRRIMRLGIEAIDG
jgi:hypothetical protein